MKKHNLRKMVPVLGLIVFVMAGSAQSLSAEERKPGWSSGFNLGAGWFMDGYLSTGFSGRAFVEYAPYIPEIGLKLTLGYFRFSDNVTTGSGAFTSQADLTYDDLYLTGGMVYRFSRSKVVPFLTGNLGVYHYRKETSEPGVGPIVDGEQVSPYSVITMSDGYAFGFNGGGGVEFFIGERTSLSLESIAHFTFGDESDQIIDVTAMFRFLP